MNNSSTIILEAVRDFAAVTLLGLLLGSWLLGMTAGRPLRWEACLVLVLLNLAVKSHWALKQIRLLTKEPA